MTTLPLEGIRVADFGQFVAGAGVGQHLAELGATVVKIEPPDGEASRTAGMFGVAMVRTNNRDKLGLAIDLQRPEGTAAAQRLIATSDVVVENMRPGTMERLGLGPERATALNPRIVYLSISAFGRDAAPTRAGFDIAAQAESGMMSVTGEADREPQRIGFVVADESTSYAATNAVLAALFRRERTGSGAVIDTSLLQVAVHVQGPSWVAMFTSGKEPMRKGNGQPHAAPAAEVISVKDGQIVLSAYTEKHWRRLCKAINRPELGDDERFCTNGARLAHRQEMRDVLSAALSNHTLTEATDFLGKNGIVAGAIRTYQQVVDGEDAHRLDLFPSTEGDDVYRYAASPYSFRDLPRRPSRCAPTVGEHSRDVLCDLGYDEAEVDQLVTDGVIIDGRAPSRGRDGREG